VCGKEFLTNRIDQIQIEIILVIALPIMCSFIFKLMHLKMIEFIAFGI